MARVRSPNYPAMSLPAALEKVHVLQKAEGKNAVPREVIAKHIGFGGLNGASATALSALGKYGLLEGTDDGEARITDLAMRILYPHDAEEKQQAITEAAFRPALFARLREKWPDRPPSDESLRSYLIREGFSASAVEQVIQFYRETLDIAASALRAQNPGDANPKESRMEHASSTPTGNTSSAPPPLARGRPFNIAFDGSVLTGSLAIRSARDIDRLVKVLEAQKPAFEAMQEDDDLGAFDEPSRDDQKEPGH